MVNFFRHSYLQQLIAIVVLIFVLWLPAFFQPTSGLDFVSPTTPLYNVLARLLSFSPMAMKAFAEIVFIVSAFIFNSMLSVNLLVTRNSSLGSLMFAIFLCFTPEQRDFYPFLLASPLIMMALQTMCLLYQEEKSESYLLNCGVFLSIASMLYFPSVLLILWMLLAMMTMKFKSERLYFIPVLGFLMPYAILFSISYFTRTLTETIDAYSSAFSGFSFSMSGLRTKELIIFISIALLLLLSMLLIKSGNIVNSIQTRKKYGVILILLLFGIVMLFMQKPVFCNGLLFFVMSIVSAMALSDVRKTRMADILLLAMMLAAITNQYLPLIL
ncbi:MAG: DUF6427 family protein [Candidatus Limimorpha sp.]